MSEVVGVFDTETTGLDAETNFVIECCIRLGLEDDAETHLWRIRPPISIPVDATNTHGIRDEDLADCPTFGEVADDVARKLERCDVLVGYNPQYDKDFLNAEFKRAGLEVRWAPILICCKRLWDIYDPPPPRKLIDAYAKFVDAKGFEGAHGALPDARATAQVMRGQLRHFALEGKPWVELDPERLKWWGPTRHAIWNEDDLTCNFGKNAGTKWGKLDKGFLNWIVEKDFPPHVKLLARATLRELRQVAPTPQGALYDPVVVAVNAWARRNPP